MNRMRILRTCIALCGVALVAVARAQPAQSPVANGSVTNSATRFDPNDPTEVRLWTGRAPGAVGDDPSHDIPFVRVFRAQADTAGARMPGARILLIPGGGYDRLTDADEQKPVAEFFSKTLHVTTFLVRYRLAQRDGVYRYPIPIWDGQRALKLIRAQAARFGVDPARIGVFGFSAGGHLATMLALHPDSDFGLPARDAVDQSDGRPAWLGLGYPVISMDPADIPPSGSYRNLLRGYKGAELRKLQDYLSGEKQVTPHTPPVFIFESMDDARISPQNTILFVDALRKTDVPVESHIFAHGVHGAGLAKGIAGEEAWPDMFARWLRQRGS